LFFGHPDLTMSRQQVRTAKTVCSECPVRLDCLYEAFKTQEQFGIWGGLTRRERFFYIEAAKGNPQRAMLVYLNSGQSTPKRKARRRAEEADTGS
jgi:hypothetical protein